MGEMETSRFKNLELKKRNRSAGELMEDFVEDICIEA